MRAILIAAALLGPAWAELPGVDTKGLSETATKQLEQLLQEGPCPCDKTGQTSMFQCVTAKTCPDATALAVFGAETFRAGKGVDEVREAVIKRYMDQFMSFDFKLDGVPRKGAAKPKVVIVEFADFECPHCALMGGVLSEVVKAHPNDVAVYFKQFPLQHHEFSELAARAALAAHAQGKFWPMHDIIFRNQMRLEADSFKKFAAELGLNVPRWEKDLQSPEVAQRVQADLMEGREAVHSTPTLFVNRKYYHGEKSPEAIKAYIAALLGKK